MTDNTPTTKQEEGGLVTVPTNPAEAVIAAWKTVSLEFGPVMVDEDGPYPSVRVMDDAIDALSAPANPPHNEDGLRKALEKVMVGGNHLANVLIGNLGAGFAEKFPPEMDTQDALSVLGATDTYDVWCCWRSIMLARQALGDIPSG